MVSYDALDLAIVRGAGHVIKDYLNNLIILVSCYGLIEGCYWYHLKIPIKMIMSLVQNLSILHP